MRAVVRTKVGPPEILQVREVPKPVPGDTQVLVKVLAASANALDWRPFTFPRVDPRLAPKDSLERRLLARCLPRT
jgi:NADPH:quinone reductase-like Zn-dependent oxidoreductase